MEELLGLALLPHISLNTLVYNNFKNKIAAARRKENLLERMTMDQMKNGLFGLNMKEMLLNKDQMEAIHLSLRNQQLALQSAQAGKNPLNQMIDQIFVEENAYIHAEMEAHQRSRRLQERIRKQIERERKVEEKDYLLHQRQLRQEERLLKEQKIAEEAALKAQAHFEQLKQLSRIRADQAREERRRTSTLIVSPNHGNNSSNNKVKNKQKKPKSNKSNSNNNDSSDHGGNNEDNDGSFLPPIFNDRPNTTGNNSKMKDSQEKKNKKTKISLSASTSLLTPKLSQQALLENHLQAGGAEHGQSLVHRISTGNPPISTGDEGSEHSDMIILSDYGSTELQEMRMNGNYLRSGSNSRGKKL